MTTYESTINYLYHQLPAFSVIGPGAYKPGLGNAITLDEAFGNAHKSFKTIHIAGTNGKGSTSNMIASILQEAGYKVGLYTSPHIFDFRERIRVDGAMIEREAVVDFVGRYKSMRLDCQPSFFELTTIMAFEYFRRLNVDIAVIETGLGGRLDTTNIIDPIISIITNISLDHTSLLGDTDAQIAREKGGIIKPGIPVVIGQANKETRAVFYEIAKEKNSPVCFAQDSPIEYRDIDAERYYFYDSHRFKCDLKGEFQLQNINTVLHAMDILDIADTESIIKGLENVSSNTGLIGRWSIVRESEPQVIFDTGHNIGAWEYLAPALAKISKDKRLHIVLGFVEDKDIARIFEILPRKATYYFVTPSVKRGRDTKDLVLLAEKHGLKSTAYPTVAEGVHAAYGNCGPSDVLFIGGSNYVASEVDLSIFK